MSLQIVKRPFETFPVSLDFTQEMAEGETPQDLTVIAIERCTGRDSTADVVSTGVPPVLAGNVALLQLQGGNPLESHWVKVQVITNFLNQYQDEVQLEIVEAV